MRKLICCMLLAAAVLCLSACAANGQAPAPERVQVVNPLMQTGSLAEMEALLDFSVPVLDKPVEAYIVLVIDGYPTNGRICYADGSDFNITYGSGDVSGIYGGTPEKSADLHGVTVNFFTSGELRYALWEAGGFSCSLTGGEALEAEVAALLAD